MKWMDGPWAWDGDGDETGWNGRRVWLIRGVGTGPFGVEVSLVST